MTDAGERFSNFFPVSCYHSTWYTYAFKGLKDSDVDLFSRNQLNSKEPALSIIKDTGTETIKQTPNIPFSLSM